MNSENPSPVTVSEQRLADLVGMDILDNGNTLINTNTLTTDIQKDTVAYLAQREYWEKVLAGTFTNIHGLTDAEINVIIDDIEDLLDGVTKSSSSSGTYGESGYDTDNFNDSSASSDSSDSSDSGY